MNGLLKYNYADPDATGVAHDNIDGILAGNRQDKLEKDIATHGGIGPTPYIQSQEGQQALMDIAMGSAFPGAAVGRVSKAAITGGKSARSIKQLLEDINTRYGMRPIPGKPGAVYGRFHGQRIDNSHRLIDVAEKNLISWNNKIDKARLRAQKILDKHGITHPDNLRQGSKYKPSDYPEVPLEPTIRMILNKIKEN